MEDTGSEGKFRFEERSFECKALNKVQPYSIYIPSGKPPEGGWGLLLFLHGRGRNHRTIAGDQACVDEISKHDYVVVFPQGDDGWYIDSKARPESRYQSMLVELMEIVRNELPVTSDPKRTGITGWSMGGFGAMRFAEDHPDKVHAVAPLIPLLDYPNPDLPEDQNYHSVPPIFGKEKKERGRFNCIHDAEKVRNKKLFIIPAKKDRLLLMARNFKAELDRLKIEYRYIEIDGGHTLTDVKKSIPMILEFMDESLIGAVEK